MQEYNLLKIAIADDHVVLRQGLIALLKEHEDMKVVINVSNGEELLQELNEKMPDIVLLDIEMPIMDGRLTLEKIRSNYPEIKVIVMSVHFNDAYIIDFIKNGACAFLSKNCGISKIVEAIQQVHEEGFYYDSDVAAAMAVGIKSVPDSAIEALLSSMKLTMREMHILQLICSKKTSAEIAERLGVSVRTIEGHRYNIYKKTKTTNLDTLIEYANKHKLLL